MKAPFPYYGGKKNVKDAIMAKMTKVWKNDGSQTYHEPFVGGGTLLWELQPDKAVISDINCWLMNLYRSLKKSLPDLLDLLDKFEESEYKADRKFFDANKARFNALKDKVTLRNFNVKPDSNQLMLAAQFYYMCKRGFGGIVNVKEDGTADVRYAQTKIDGRYLYDYDNLEEVSDYLNKATVNMYCGNFKKILKDVRKGDVVYLDPPYYSEVPCTDSYWSTPFGAKEQEELAEEVRRLAKLGAYVLVSNSDYKFVRDIYKGFKIQKLTLRRTVNMSSAKTHNEVLVTNF